MLGSACLGKDIFGAFKTKDVSVMISELLGMPLVTWGATNWQVVTMATSVQWRPALQHVAS